VTFDPTRFVSFDLETYLIEAGLLAPRIVCGSIAWLSTFGSLEGFICSTTDDDENNPSLFRQAHWLLTSDRIIVGANIAYDFGCLAAADPDLLPLIFKAYEENRVFDIQIAQALHHIAEGNLYLDPLTGQPLKGRYSLDRCVQFVLGRDNAKENDFWRLRYALLADIPIEQWPEEAKQYPIDDAVNTLEVAIAQVNGGGKGVTPGPHKNLGDLSNQCETAFALHLGAMWGLRTDREKVEALRRRTEDAHIRFVDKFERLGFFKEGKKDLRAIKRAVIKAYGGGDACQMCTSGKVLSPISGNAINCKACSGTGLDPSSAPKTAADGVSADRDALMESGDPDLVALGDNEPEKVRETYLPWLETGIDRPISLRPNVLVASGRTSYDGLIQLLPREGGVRDCFKARPGYVYCSVDYAALELCTLAQVCLWILDRSQMAETINATGDPGSLHTALAASMCGITAEEMTARIKRKDEEAKKYRQAAKALNFGLPGGMGAAKLVLAKRKKNEGSTELPDGTKIPGIRFCVLIGGQERCGVEKVTEWKGRATPPICKACVELVETKLRPQWFDQWPEIKAYFAWIANRVGEGGVGELPAPMTERVRGGLDFTNGANTMFQSPAADGAKNALRKLVRESYLDSHSSLYGTRPIMFVHDEIIAEMPEERAHEAGPRMADLMVSAMREYVPDVCIRAEPALMRHWVKSAEPTYRNGLLIPWEDREPA
jgi:DNA polymerase-1